MPVCATLISAQYRSQHDASEGTPAIEAVVVLIAASTITTTITSTVAAPSPVISLCAVAIVAATASIAVPSKAGLVEFAAPSIASVVGKCQVCVCYQCDGHQDGDARFRAKR